MTVSPLRSTEDKREVTRVFYGVETVISTVIEFLNQTNNVVYACVDQTRPILTLDILVLKNAFLDAKNRGIKLLYITEITKDNLTYCKELMKMTHELRHLDGIKGNFYISESGYLAPATLHEKGKPASQIIYSNVNEIIEHQKYVFDSFWDRAIPAEQRIKEIEEGAEAEFTKVITDSNRVTELIVEFAKSVKREAQMLLPDSNSMIMLDELGVWDYLIQAAKQKGADIRVLCYISDSNENADGIVRRISSHAPSIRIFSTPSSEAVLFIVDNEKFLRIEEKDTGAHTPTPTHISDAISLAIWSNSKKGTASFKSIFDILWKQTDLYQQLKVHDKMQKEFINVAAHELRTPIQPILGLGEVLRSKNRLKAEEYEEYLDVIIRNARRLQQLADDILDVTKIESKSLKLKKEGFDLQELIIDIVNEYNEIIKKSNKNINLAYVPKIEKGSKSILVEADRGRVSQVVSNLLVNALKFTEEGSIIVTTAINVDNNKNAIIVSVRDSGAGINCEILPQLFAKFASKSFQGTGLGLFISKSIIEAHDGRIWAENNPGEKGATFTFTLPLSISH